MAGGTAKLPVALIVTRQWRFPAARSLCFVMAWASLVDVALLPMMSGIAHTDHQTLELIEAVSGLQALLWVLQLHQKQLELFFPR